MPLGSKCDGEYALTNPSGTTAPAYVAFTDSAVEVGAALSVGTHLLAAQEDCYWLQGATGATAVTAAGGGNPGHWLPAGASRLITVTAAANAYVQAIRRTTSGNLCISLQ